MKLYAPKYYRDFACIADKCTHSCCIGWEIDIDSETLKKYNEISRSYGKTVKNSISMEDTPHFRLCEGEKCPHLNEKGLCEIILNLGEDYLCDICREHPRFYNLLSNRREVGVGMACREAARLILSSEDYTVIEIDVGDGEEYFAEFDVLPLRNRIYEILQNEENPYNCRIESVCEEFGITQITDEEDWQDILNNLEYLDESHKTLFLEQEPRNPIPSWSERYLQRAMAYFVYRHCSDVADQYEFSAALGFCLFCHDLLAALICSRKAETLEDIIDFAVTVSEEIEYSEDNTYEIKSRFE